MVIKNEVAEVRITLLIYEDLTWKCTYFGKEVNPSCPVLTSVPSHVTCFAKVVKLLTTLTEAIGNYDDNFITMSEKKGKFVNIKGDVVAFLDSKGIHCNGHSISKTIRHINCELLLVRDTSNRCEQCIAYRLVLGAMHRHFKQRHVPSKLSDSHINNRYLSSPEKVRKINELQANLRAAHHKLNEIKQFLTTEVEEKGMQLHDDTHNDLLSIMQENSQNIESNFPNNSFRQLFWKQQFEAALKNNPKQMKWHPLMIKWCLSIKLKSSTTYEKLYTSGLLRLPSQRTLRDYTHVIKPSRGEQL